MCDPKSLDPNNIHKLLNQERERARGREDPTVRKLEEIAAEKMGKEDTLLVPGGTMGNLVSVLSHAKEETRS